MANVRSTQFGIEIVGDFSKVRTTQLGIEVVGDFSVKRTTQFGIEVILGPSDASGQGHRQMWLVTR